MNASGLRLIAVFARHRTAANILMALMVLLGVLGLARMNIQSFPTVGINSVTVNVSWPGASAEDIDAGMVAAIEREVRVLNNVKRVVSRSAEGVGLIVVQYEPGTDPNSARAAVENAVAKIKTLPKEAEPPVVSRIYVREPIGNVVVSGPFPEAAIRAYAKEIRDGLLAAGVDNVETYGSRRQEIWVEADAGRLRQLDLTLNDIAASIRQSSADVPAGVVHGGVDKQIRSLGLGRSVEEIGRTEVIVHEDGARVRLREIAAISEEFNEQDPTALRRGHPAVELRVLRAPNSNALEQHAILQAHLDRVRPTLPSALSVEHYQKAANQIRDRIHLLVRNGANGLVLVLLILFVFLNARVAFWVAAGIPVSVLATLGVMMFTGQSINVVTLFGLTMAIGIVVDDAIVVSEHAVTLRAAGADPAAAAEGSAQRMLTPVLASTLTTVAGFLPLLVVSDVIGQLIRELPLVVVAVLCASLIECFLVLPRHMHVALRAGPGSEHRFRRWFNRGFDAFRDGPFTGIVRGCIAWRYLTVSAALGLLLLSVGLLASGRVPFVFFHAPEEDSILVNVVFVDGTRRETTTAMMRELDRALYQAEAALTGGARGLVVMSLGQVGKPVTRGTASAWDTGDHLGGMRVEIVPSSRRTVRTQALIEEWRRRVRPLPGLETLTMLQPQTGTPGREIDIRLTGDDLPELKEASNAVRALLGRFPAVSDIDDDTPYGKQEAALTLTPQGRALGFTIGTAAEQVRASLQGVIARRFARGDEEVSVRVSLPRRTLTEAGLRRTPLRSATGAEVPLSEVVDFTEKAGFAQIRRENGQRMIAITAEVDESVSTPNEILAELQAGELPEIARRHGAGFLLRGRAEEQATTLGDMKTGAVLGIGAIYLILAWVFSSYSVPLLVMAIIPFGIVGAILGHLALGYAFAIQSVIALFGLTGIAVNNSIILMSVIQDRLAAGEPRFEALARAAGDRLHASVVTSSTTVLGLLPLLSETARHAQFLKPMAITIVFGLIGVSLLVLVLIPSLMAIHSDLASLFRGLAAAYRPARRAKTGG